MVSVGVIDARYVAPFTERVSVGEVVPMPTLLFKESTYKVSVSKATSPDIVDVAIPETSNCPPTDKFFAVERLPEKTPVVPVNAPVRESVEPEKVEPEIIEPDIVELEIVAASTFLTLFDKTIARYSGLHVEKACATF